MKIPIKFLDTLRHFRFWIITFGPTRLSLGALYGKIRGKIGAIISIIYINILLVKSDDETPTNHCKKTMYNLRRHAPDINICIIKLTIAMNDYCE